MATIECKCGYVLDSRGMSSHLRGGRHKMRMTRKRYSERGMAALWNSTGRMAERLGVPGTWDIENYIPGIRGRSGIYTYGYYVREDIADILSDVNIPLQERKERALSLL